MAEEDKPSPEQELERIKQMWEEKLKQLEEREKQLLNFDEMMRSREEEWKSKLEEEETRIKSEQQAREAELKTREIELESKYLVEENQKLADAQKRLQERQEELQRKQGEFTVRRERSEEPEETQTKDIYQLITQELKGVAEDAVVLISSRSESHMQLVLAVMALLSNERKQGGIYISVSRPYRYILNSLKENDIEYVDLYAVDCVSQMAGKVAEKTENVLYVENPSSLEEITMYVDKLLGRVRSDRKFLILDSLSSLLIYNNAKSVKEFIHFIINKMRLEGMGGIILSMEKKEANDLIQTIGPMFDKEIKV